MTAHVDVLFLGVGKAVRDDSKCPAFLQQKVDGSLYLEHIVAPFRHLHGANLIFTFLRADIDSYRLENLTSCIAPGSRIVALPAQTLGAACTGLWAVDHLRLESELILVTLNEVLLMEPVEMFAVLQAFRSRGWGAATLTFHSIHPCHSYVRVRNDGVVTEVVQGRATGAKVASAFFWFRRGEIFIRAAQSMIKKRPAGNDPYCIAPVLNEVILMGETVGAMPLARGRCMPLKSGQDASFVEAVRPVAMAK